MIRILILFFITLSFLNASLLQKIEVYESEDKNLEIKDVKNQKVFKKTKLPFIRQGHKNYFLKITFDKNKLDNRQMVVELENEFDVITVEDNIEYSTIYKNIVLNISNRTFIDEVYIKINNHNGYVNFDVNIYEREEFIQNQIIENRLYGLSNGIVFSAFLYYLALYFFNREKSYIYYSLTQLSMLSILVFASASETENDSFLIELAFLGFFIFSNLFTRYFLNTKENAPKLNTIFNYLIVFYIFDLMLRNVFEIYVFEENVPLSALLMSYLLAAYIVYSKGYKPALFYLIGWSFVILSFLFIELQYFLAKDGLFLEPIYLMHIASPLESLVLAFALSYKMKIAEEEKTQQQEFLTHQSKLASMGEMIGNIAHQWRQPLTHLSYIMMNLKTAYEKDKLSKEYFDKKSKEATSQLEYMSHTIDDFRNFFKMSKQKEKFSLVKSIDEVISLLDASLNSHKISLDFIYKKDLEITSLRGEFLQVLFNIINNAKDEFVSNGTNNAHILINLEEKEDEVLIKISDNAGGIDESIIDKIFEPYFTTKDKGLGIGLYMSNMIIEKNIGGKIEVQNKDDGVMFVIKLDKS